MRRHKEHKLKVVNVNKNALFYSNYYTENGCCFREKMNNDNFRETDIYRGQKNVSRRPQVIM